MQSDLPLQNPPRNLEYLPGGDADPPWCVERWPALAELFDLRENEVVPWHRALAGQGRPWLVIRRLHQIAPVWGDGSSADDLKAWTYAELAANLGVPEVHLKKDLESARVFWKKVRLSQAAGASLKVAGASLKVAGASSARPCQERPAPSSSDPSDSPATVKPLDGLPEFQIHQDFSEDQVTAILTPFRFNSIRSVADRIYVANRILELRKMLEDKYKREQARQLIVMELNMANHEATLQALKGRLETLQNGKEISKDQATEVRNIADSINTTEVALTKLSTTYRNAADELGGDEMEQGEMRRLAVGTISHLAEAHRLYYLDGSRSLIDGMFTAEEVVWLTTPLTIRPAQYRPDVVLRMREACDPENLWGRDYQPSVIQREACRRLAKLTQMLADETEPQIIPEIDDQASDPDDPADGQADDPPPPEPHPNSIPSQTSDYHTPPPRADEPFMAVG